MKSITYCTLFVLFTTSPLWFYHTQIHNGLHILQALLALFCSINTMICIWEMTLFFYPALIKSQYNAYKRKVGKGALPSPFFLFEEVKLRQALSMQHWTKVWSTYSLMDPSYSDPTTFGYLIDVGNGFSTILPSILFGIGMTWDIMSARVLGLIGMVSFYQEFYGTVIYFLSYVWNGRYVGEPALHLAIVIISNGIWMAFPGLGMYVSYLLIDSNSYGCVRYLQ